MTRRRGCRWPFAPAKGEGDRRPVPVGRPAGGPSAIPPGPLPGETMRQILQRLAVPAVVGLGLLLAGCRGRYTQLPESGATLEGTVTYGPAKVPCALIIVQGT